MAMKFRPLHDRVLVRRVTQDEKSAGGIIIPETAQEKPQEGEIVAAGSGRISEDGAVHALDVKAGDKILFGKWSGCLLYTSPSPRDRTRSRMPSSA